MSWIVPPPTRTYAWYLRPLFALLRSRGGLTSPVRLWGRTPRVFLSFLRLFKAVDRASSPIPGALRCLLMVRVSQLNVCRFCVDLNGSRALAHGVPEEKLLQLDAYERSPLFAEPERAALAFADATTLTGGRIGVDLQARLRASFSDDDIVELAALIAFQNMSSKFNFALDVEPAGFCRLPAPAPAPAAGTEPLSA